MDTLEVHSSRRHRLSMRLWREWCFARVAARHVWTRALAMLVILLGGALLFQHYEPERGHSLVQATYYTFSLIFGEVPEEFPRRSGLLQALFFIVPILGLTVIIEGIVDFALMLRDRRRHERSWCTTMAASLSNHIVLVGLGRLGYSSFRLLRKLGEPVVVIERDPHNQFLEDVRRDGSPLLIGDARREALLNDANVAAARSIVLAADDDLANLEIALDARNLAPGICVVLRMFDQNMADKIRAGFGIHIAMSQSALSAPAFATAALEASIVSGLVINRQMVVMQNWRVSPGDALCGRTVGDLLGELSISVVQRQTGDGEPQLFPAPATRLAPGDELLVQGRFDQLTALRQCPATKLTE